MKCKKCNNELEFIPNYVHEDIETNLDVTHDVHKCLICESLHYKENGYDITEIPVRETRFTYVAQKSDYDVALIKMKEKEEYAEEI